MSNFSLAVLKSEDFPFYHVQKFLFNMIREEYGYGFIPEYHQDIIDMENYYIKPKNNNLFIVKHNITGEIMGTMGIRAYDKNFQLKNLYTKETTASIWRVFIHKKWRRNGVATALVRYGEKFCRKNGYKKIYLHTHKSVPGALDFWLYNGYNIVEDTNNNLKTVHMDKIL